MENDTDLLDEALAKGILTAEQRAQLEALKKSEEAPPSPDERFRIVNGFGEIFVSVGLFMLLGGLRGLLSAMIDPMIGYMLAAGAAWFGACYFTVRRRMLLPAILCCLDAAFYVGLGTAIAWWGATGMGSLLQAFDHRHTLTMTLWQAATPFALMLAVLMAAAWRFRIPFLMLPIGLMFTFLVTVTAAWHGNDISYRLILGACGFTMLAVALRFDFQDPQRQKRSSDFAFWCYVIGSPLTVHPLLLTILFSLPSKGHGDAAFPLIALMLLISLLISAVALLINRRALVLSTLIYVSIGLVYALTKIGSADSKTIFLCTTLIIGTYVVVLGTGWKRIRHTMMARLTPRPWFAKLPPF